VTVAAKPRYPPTPALYKKIKIYTAKLKVRMDTWRSVWIVWLALLAYDGWRVVLHGLGAALGLQHD